jgi:hypothetical protein
MSKDEPFITNSSYFITEAMAAATADTLSTSPLPIFQGRTLEEFLQLASHLNEPEADAYVFYFGYTGRQIKVEYLRFLTVRGASQQDEDGTFIDPSARNKPVLVPLRGRFVTVLLLRRLCILLYCRSDGCMATTWPLEMCAMLKISSGRRDMGGPSVK